MATLKKYFLLILISLFAFARQLSAIPAKPDPIIITQPDGTELTVKLHGNEFFHYITTLDGFIIEKNTDGFFYYRELNNKNEMAFSSVKVSDSEKRTAIEKAYLAGIDQQTILETLQAKNLINTPQRTRPTSVSARKTSGFPLEGTPRSLVVLVEFPNCAYRIENPYESFYKMLNEEGYSEYGATGSVRDYFIENSNGTFQPHFDLYRPIMLPENYDYYGVDTSTSYVGHSDELVIDACLALAETGLINFADYDLDQDGFLDNIYLFFAGYSQAETGISNQLWPHAGKLTDFGYTGEYAVIIDGVQIDSYACANELKGKSGAEMAGIGAFVHEFCHVLGLPDLYVTNNGNAFTPGPWSVLDSRPYNNEGRTPPNMSAFERYSLGWLNPFELNSIQNVELADITNNVGFLITTETDNEYYILENRQLKGWDAYLPNHGMLIWHIDYDEEIWQNNAVNNILNHQRVDLIEADGTQYKDQREGHSFPGTANVTEFTDYSIPSMRTWDGSYVNKPITAITEDIEAGIIFFKFMGGKLGAAPIAEAADQITQTSFIANWGETEEANSYYLDVYYYNEAETAEYDPAYQNLNVGNVFSYQVKRLEPGTQYYYVVRGAHEYDTTGNSNEIAVKTLDGTFDFFSPVALEATEVTETSFTANWEAMEEAISYTLNVYEKNITQPEGEEKVDFTNGLDLPEGWSTTCIRAYYTNGYFGESAPSLYFNQDGFYLESPVYDEEISSFTFWYRGDNTKDSHWIQFNGHTGKVWVENIYSYSSLTTAEGGEIITLDEDVLKGYYGIQVVYRREGTSIGNLALDDVIVGYGKNFEEKYLTGYKSLEVGNNLSYDIQELEEGTNYYYTVIASNGEVESATSNEVKVVTKGGVSDIKETKSQNRTMVKEDILYLFSEEENILNIEIFDSMGCLAMKQKFMKELQLSIKGWSKGVYLIRIEGEIFKILL